MADRASVLTRLSAVPANQPIVLDGLAFGALPEIGALQRRVPLIALVHQPLALDPSLDTSQADSLRVTERAALAAAERVIVTSEATARIMRTSYDVPRQRISVVQPGTDPALPAPGNRDGVVHLLSVGSIAPIKGYDVLIRALATLTEMPWRLTIAGDRTRNPATAAQLDSDIESYGLSARISVLGAVPPERIDELFLASDLFVLASRFESYGMALAEAIAHGLPIVSTNTGAIPQTVTVRAALLVPPDDAAALAQALRCLIGAPAERRRLAMNARAAAARLPTWRDSARLFAGVVQTVAL
jgi:glycosyltransferase involved in cell wall biosynthesis